MSLRPPIVFFYFAKWISSKIGLRAQSVDSMRYCLILANSAVRVTFLKWASLV